jgi:hypothetical protein
MLPLIDQRLQAHPSLSLKIVLDHAGGHDAVDRRCLTRRKSLSTLSALPSKVVRVPRPVRRTASDPHQIKSYAGEETPYQLCSPTKKRNKKLYIRVMNLDDEEAELITATSTSKSLYHPIATRKMSPRSLSSVAKIKRERLPASLYPVSPSLTKPALIHV